MNVLLAALIAVFSFFAGAVNLLQFESGIVRGIAGRIAGALNTLPFFDGNLDGDINFDGELDGQ